MTPDASTDDRERRQRAQAAAFDAIGARYADIADATDQSVAPGYSPCLPPPATFEHSSAADIFTPDSTRRDTAPT